MVRVTHALCYPFCNTPFTPLASLGLDSMAVANSGRTRQNSNRDLVSLPNSNMHLFKPLEVHTDTKLEHDLPAALCYGSQCAGERLWKQQCPKPRHNTADDSHVKQDQAHEVQRVKQITCHRPASSTSSGRSRISNQR